MLWFFFCSWLLQARFAIIVCVYCFVGDEKSCGARVQAARREMCVTQNCSIRLDRWEVNSDGNEENPLAEQFIQSQRYLTSLITVSLAKTSMYRRDLMKSRSIFIRNE